MSEHYLFQSGEVSVSRRLARFGDTTYQVANISLVRIGSRRKLNAIAILLFLVGAGILFYAFSQVLPTDTRLMIGLVGVSFVVVALVIQKFWPKREFTFSLRANSGDVETFVTNDSQFATDVKRALEDAFSAQP